MAKIGTNMSHNKLVGEKRKGTGDLLMSEYAMEEFVSGVHNFSLFW